MNDMRGIPSKARAEGFVLSEQKGLKLNGIGVLRCRLGAIWRFRRMARRGICKTLSPHEAALVAQWLADGFPERPRAPP